MAIVKSMINIKMSIRFLNTAQHKRHFVKTQLEHPKTPFSDSSRRALLDFVTFKIIQMAQISQN